MNEIRHLIDINSKYMYEIRIGQPRKHNLKFFKYKFSIVGNFLKNQITIFGLNNGLDDPTPAQYAIIKNSPNALKTILDLSINQSGEDPLDDKKEIPGCELPIRDIFNPTNDNSTNVKISLIHLSILLYRKECFQVLFSFLCEKKEQSFLNELINTPIIFNTSKVLLLNLAVAVETQSNDNEYSLIKQLLDKGAKPLKFHKKTDIDNIEYNEIFSGEGEVCPFYYCLKFHPNIFKIFLNFILLFDEEKILNFQTKLKTDGQIKKIIDRDSSFFDNFSNFEQNFLLSISQENRAYEKVHDINTIEEEYKACASCKSTKELNFCQLCEKWYCDEHYEDHECSLNTI